LEDRSRDFEKVFAEFLSGVNSREDREREGLRDREIRGEAGPQARKAEETGPPRELSSREAESPRETGTPQEAEVPRGPQEEGISRETPRPDAGEENIRPLRFGGGPEKKFEEFREESGDFSAEEFLLAGNFDVRGPEFQTRDGTAEPAEGGEGFSPAEPADAGGEKIPPQESFPVKNSPAKDGPAVKSREGEKEDESYPALSQKTLDFQEGGQEGNFPVPEKPYGEPEGKPPELRAGEKVQPHLASSAEGGLRAFAPPKQEEEKGEIPVPAPTLEQEKPREGKRKVELRDYREKPVPELQVNSDSNSSNSSPSPESPGQFSARSGPELFSRDSIPVDLNSPGEPAGGGRVFEDALARELRQNLNSDIVRHAQVILRDKGEGLIRLSLRPESLGNVKIRLELTENKIAGRIIVESSEALRAFEREIASLERSFRDSGYESAELSAFLSQDGSGGTEEEGNPFYSPRFALEKARYDEILERTDTSFPGLPGNGLGPGNGHIQINILI
jgi:flagellar hook-length control protein FliK